MRNPEAVIRGEDIDLSHGYLVVDMSATHNCGFQVWDCYAEFRHKTRAIGFNFQVMDLDLKNMSYAIFVFREWQKEDLLMVADVDYIEDNSEFLRLQPTLIAPSHREHWHAILAHLHIVVSQNIIHDRTPTDEASGFRLMVWCDGFRPGQFNGYSFAAQCPLQNLIYLMQPEVHKR